MRVGWVPLQRSRSVASARLRSFEPMRLLRQQGIDAGLYDRTAPGRYDAVVFQKAYSAADLDDAARLKDAGTRIVFDLCDNHWYRDQPDDAHAERTARLDRMVQRADLVTVSTPELGEIVPAPVAIVDDALDPVARTLPARLARRVPRPASGLLWFGNAGSVDPPFGLIDLLGLVPELNRLAEGHPVTLTLVTDTAAPLVREVRRAATFPVRARSWRYPTFGAIASRHLVCLLPAQANPFTTAKTSNRAVTALRCGLAVVAGDLPAYRRLGEGVRIDDWQVNLAQYLDDPGLALAEAERGRALVEARFAPATIAAQWADALRRAMDTST